MERKFFASHSPKSPLTIHHNGVNYDREAPTDLRPGSLQGGVSRVERLAVTGTALRSAAALGFGRAEIVATIQTMQRQHFYKSMTAYADHRLWQDVYHIPLGGRGALYQV